MLKPCLPISQPRPPPSVSPAIPGMSFHPVTTPGSAVGTSDLDVAIEPGRPISAHAA